jgi:LmbE family N-acetylglucosaminyl deacetylase
MTQRTLLFIYAHPDDESFWGVGAAARYRGDGVRVVLVMATRGERGTCGTPPLCTIAELPQVRERELREAARIAGIDHVEFLDYEDQKLTDAPADAVRRTLVTLVRRERPSVVGTFDPDGGNRHPDHMAISRFTAEAVGAAADPRWYADVGAAHEVPRVIWTPPVRPWETVRSDLEAQPGVDYVLDTSREWRVRADALAAHRTQREGIDKLFLKRADVEQVLSVEVFRHAWGVPPSRRPAADLFEGLE